MNTPSILCANAHLTYPHCNGFFDDGQRLVMTRQNGEVWELFALNFETGAEEKLCIIDRREDRDLGGNTSPVFDVAFEAAKAVFKQKNSLWLLDLQGALKGEAEPEPIYTPAPEATVNLLASIAHDGSHIIFKQESDVEGPFHEGNHSGNRLNVASGEVETLVRTRWWADHFQPCPHDENWIGYGRQTWGTPEYNQPGDIMYAWHPTEAPDGKCIFDQFAASGTPGKPLFTTHDRWAFHEACLLCIVYPDSPGGPRGLYQVWPDGRARCVSEGNQDWHCDIRRDGRLAVVDSSGVYTWNDPAIDELPGNSDIILIEMESGKRRFLARTTWGGPQHPHPIFTPDGRKVLYHQSSYYDGKIDSTVMQVEVPVL